MSRKLKGDNSRMSTLNSLETDVSELRLQTRDRKYRRL